MKNTQPIDRTGRLAGIGYMVFGIASFASMDAVGKWLVRDFSVFQILAVRSTVVTLALVAWLLLTGGFSRVRSTQLGAHWVRALCGVGAFLFFFTSVRFLPLADAVAVAFGGPFIVTALSVPLLREHVDARRWFAIAIGFVGMVLIVQPTGDSFRPAALLVIAASFSYALMMILTRWMALRREDEKTSTFIFYTFLVQAISGSLACALAPGSVRSMNGRDLALIVAMGVLALGGHFGITRAFQRSPVSVVAPFEYSAVVWATVLGFVVFGEFPSASVWIGVSIIVAAGLYAIHRERT